MTNPLPQTTAQAQPPADITYEQFCESWMDEVTSSLAAPSGQQPDPNELRREVVRKLLCDAIESDLDDGEFVYLGAGEELGIDAFTLDDGSDEGEGEAQITARVVRFLRPSDWQQVGVAIAREARKMRLALDAAPRTGELEPLLDLWRTEGEPLRLCVLFVSLNPLPEAESQALAAAEVLLSRDDRLTLSVDAVSLHTIYTRGGVDHTVQVPLKVRVPDVEAGAQLVIGAVSLLDLLDFLRNYKEARGDLDVLYEKNVRVFLGRTGKINKGISKTLREEPQNFGLYNNGLTIVAHAIEQQEDGSFLLSDPSVVNGCQTTRTLWETLNEKLRAPVPTDAEGREKQQEWRANLERGRVVVKVVRVAPGESQVLGEGEEGQEKLLEQITRYTNSQNAVKDKDFIALNRDFRRWKRELATHSIFLEILRNEGTLQSARQKSRGYNGPRYATIARAFELLKVYGAGWMDEPGAAWNKNAAFVPPQGAIFKRITQDETFGGDDLRAALWLQARAEELKFGKRGPSVPVSRRLTRFLFFRSAIELLRRLLRRFELPDSRRDCTRALLALHLSTSEWELFTHQVAVVIDGYMNVGSDYSVHKEPGFADDFNAFLKKDNLAKSESSFPELWKQWNLRENLLLAEMNGPSIASRLEPVLRRAFENVSA